LVTVEASQNIRALITKVSNPKVKIFIGRVKIKINGRIVALIIPKIAEVRRADQKEENVIPGVR